MSDIKMTLHDLERSSYVIEVDAYDFLAYV